MKSVQEAGKEILGGSPGKFYVFIGSEYGIKSKYIDILANHYGSKIEYESVDALLSMMQTKRIIPLKPSLYVVRYDETFISTLSDAVQKKIASTNIVGTIVCLYEQPKHTSKVSKYLPDYTVAVDAVSEQFVKKYLHSDFPGLADRFIDIAVASSANYGHAKSMCRCMKYASAYDLYNLSDAQIAKMFGYVNVSSEDKIRKGVASKNFGYLLNVVESYEGEPDAIMYSILSTMIELDKCLDSKYAQSDLRPFANQWKREDVYNMFMNTYEELAKLRSSSAPSDAMNSIIYLMGLLQFSTIPSVEVMS